MKKQAAKEHFWHLLKHRLSDREQTRFALIIDRLPSEEIQMLANLIRGILDGDRI